MNCKLFMPVQNRMINSNEMRGSYLLELQRAGAYRVFLCMGRDLLCGDDSNPELEKLKENIVYFKSYGFEVGVWINAFGFGIPETPLMSPIKEQCTKIKSVGGYLTGDAYCPSDKIFTEYYIRQIKDIAKLHPDIILLDDDMCLSVRPGLGCFCDNHLFLLANELGMTIEGFDGKLYRSKQSTEKKILFSELQNLIFCGENNKYRSAWLKVSGDTLREFCKEIRDSIDQIDNKIRAGFCAGFTSFDIEGASAEELSLILAGKESEPLLRLSGAPYWAVNHINRFADQRLHGIIEFVRVQESWCKDMGIELFSEGDVYPRPRTVVPASWLEIYDGALRASGNIHSFKYMLDYTTAPGYETGYTKFHLHNLPLYEAIDNNFANKACVGVHVYEIQHKIKDFNFPERFIGDNLIMQTAFSPASAFITENGIPTTYNDFSDVGIAFGVNAKEIIKLAKLKNLPKKLIIDMPAAIELQKYGIDLGIISCKKYLPTYETTENFGNLSDYEYSQGKGRVSLHKVFTGDIFSVELKKDANIQSRFFTDKKSTPSSYIYKYENTEFLIFAFDGYTASQSGGLFVSYERQNQLLDFCGKFYPYIKGCPYLYSIVKRNNNETVAFYANINDDAMFDFDIILDKEYSSFKIISSLGQNIKGELSNGKIRITDIIPPYGMFVLILQK